MFDDDELNRIRIMAQRHGLESWVDNCKKDFESDDCETHDLASFKIEKLLFILEDSGEDISEWFEPSYAN